MKTAKLRNTTSFWDRFSFTNNVCKMRRTLLNYLKGEGLKCEIADCGVEFDYDGKHFTADLVPGKGYAECDLSYLCKDEDYEKLSTPDKAFIADKVNTDLENHSTVFAYGGKFCVSTFFYFTGKSMLISLFSSHFEELTDSLDETLNVVKEKVDNHKGWHGKRIGFYIDDNSNVEENKPGQLQVAARYSF